MVWVEGTSKPIELQPTATGRGSSHQVLQPPEHLHSLLWTRSNSSTSLLCCCPRAGSALQGGLRRAQQRGRIPSLTCCSRSGGATQHTGGFWSQAHTEDGSWGASSHQHPQIILLRAAPSILPQPVFLLGTELTQLQDLALAQPHEVCTGPHRRKEGRR